MKNKTKIKREKEIKRHLENNLRIRETLNKFLKIKDNGPSFIVNLTAKRCKELLEKINTTPNYYLDNDSALQIGLILIFYNQLMELLNKEDKINRRKKKT
jgi:hypothetical protein